MKSILIKDLDPVWKALAKKEGYKLNAPAGPFCVRFLPSDLNQNEINKRAISMGVPATACYQWRVRAGITKDKREKTAAENAQLLLKKKIDKAEKELNFDKYALKTSIKWTNGESVIKSTEIKNIYNAASEISKLRQKYGETLFPYRRKPRKTV